MSQSDGNSGLRFGRIPYVHTICAEINQSSGRPGAKHDRNSCIEQNDDRGDDEDEHKKELKWLLTNECDALLAPRRVTFEQF